MSTDPLAAAVRLEVRADVRYWEDAVVDGVVDREGTLIPGKVGDAWHTVVDLQSGSIVGWPAGTVADIHYKVCDAGEYWLCDGDGRRLAAWSGSSVPDDLLSPGRNGFGDYIIMSVNGNGSIDGYIRPLLDPAEWKVIISATPLTIQRGEPDPDTRC